MRERICYLCEHPIFFEDYCETNKTSTDLLEIWESDYTRFLCCFCLDFTERLASMKPMDLKAWETLADWAENGRLEKFRRLGLISPSDVKEVRRLRVK